MTDLGQLTCPTCGASLEASSNMGTIKCSYCGNEFSVRQAARSMYLETFARCPLCGRNDKVEKVSAIASRDTQVLRGTQIVITPRGQRAIPTQMVATSILSQQLQPPQRPNLQKVPSKFLLFYLIFVGGFVTIVVAALMSSFSYVCSGILILLFCMGGFLVSRLDKRERTKRKVSNAEKLAKWEHAMRQWQKLYYCSRDDVVFIPGEKQAVPPGRMSEIL